jgi:hypothetical protein
MKKENQNELIFTNDAAFRIAKRQVIASVQYRFQRFSKDELDVLASDSLLATWKCMQENRLVVPPLAFAVKAAYKRACSAVNKQTALTKKGISFVDESFACELPKNDEQWGDNQDDVNALVKKVVEFMKTQSPEKQRLFDADYCDCLMNELTDKKKAQALDFKCQTAGSVRKKRCDTKDATIRHLETLPAFKRLAVVFCNPQRA